MDIILKWLKCWQISVQFYISLWRLRVGLGLGKSTVFNLFLFFFKNQCRLSSHCLIYSLATA